MKILGKVDSLGTNGYTNHLVDNALEEELAYQDAMRRVGTGEGFCEEELDELRYKWETFLGQFIEWGECVSIEFDLDEETATVKKAR